jgi:predicted nucleic acid-binding Zn ribbon protein
LAPQRESPGDSCHPGSRPAANLRLLKPQKCPKGIPHETKVKTIHEKYQEILSKEEKSRRANALIFDQTKSKAIVQSEISDMKLSKQE